MRTLTTTVLVALIGAVACAGVGYACSGPSPSSPALVWLHPMGDAFPATHTYIRCSESGANTASVSFAASRLAPGDGCQFTATLANSGGVTLAIAPETVTATPRGAPTFSTCFGYSLSPGPASGNLAIGGSFPYTLTLQLLNGAPAVCEGASGTVTITFTGTSACPALSAPPRGLNLGPWANLQGRNLAGLNLSGRDLAGDNLQGADLSCDDLAGANLAGANLQWATLEHANLVGANLCGANLQNSDLSYTDLSGADFAGTNLQGADLQGAIVSGTPHDLTDFNGANLQGIDIADVTATGYVTATGAHTQGTLNVASCTATSGTATYCALL